MRRFFVATSTLALTLLPALALGQSSRPSIGTGGQGAQGGAAAAILAASTQNSQVRASTLNITQRAPTSTDVAGYSLTGIHTWLDGSNSNQPYTLNRILNGAAQWLPAPNPGPYPATAVPGAAGSWGLGCYVANWTQAVVLAYRPSDGTTLGIGCVNGHFDIATAQKFAQPSGGIIYAEYLYDQTDNGAYDNGTISGSTYAMTQTAPANMCRIGIDVENGNNVPLVCDSTYRSYGETVSSFSTTNTSGSTSLTLSTTSTFNPIMGSGNPGAWWLYAGSSLATGTGVSGTGIPASTYISAINYTTGVITLSAATTANVSSVTFTGGTSTVGSIGSYYNLPSTLSVPFEAHSVMVSARYGANNSTLHQETTIGQSCSTANADLNYSAMWASAVTGLVNYLRIVQGNTSNGGNSNNFGTTYPTNSDQVLGYSVGGTGGRTAYVQMNNQQTIGTLNAIPLAVSLTGGCYGASQMDLSANNLAKTDDHFFYGLTIWGSSLTQAQQTTYTLSEYIARSWYPQIVSNLICDGSSTTYGLGTTEPAATCPTMSQTFPGISPFYTSIQSIGGGPAANAYGFANYVQAQANSQTKAIVWYPGMGNGFQLKGNYSVSSMSAGNANITTSTSLLTGFSPSGSLAPGVFLSGSPGGCLATGAQVLSINSNTSLTLASSAQALGVCTSITVLNETAANEWCELGGNASANCSGAPTYDAEAVTAGLKYLLIGSAVRGSFTTSNAPYGSSTQLGEFGTLKAYLMNVCGENIQTGIGKSCIGLSNAIGYIDLEMDPYWGGDSGTMTVASVISGTQVSVNATGTAVANFLVTGNRVEWSAVGNAANVVGAGAMPINTTNAAEAGVETISAVSGSSSPYTITIPSTSGLVVGQTIRAINPTPWTSYPCGLYTIAGGVWNPDNQHYCRSNGYLTQAANIAAYLLNGGYLN